MLFVFLSQCNLQSKPLIGGSLLRLYKQPDMLTSGLTIGVSLRDVLFV